jgi:hypothetical protein
MKHQVAHLGITANPRNDVGMNGMLDSMRGSIEADWVKQSLEPIPFVRKQMKSVILMIQGILLSLLWM